MTHGGKREGAGRKASDNPRKEVISAKVTAEEKEKIKESARNADMTISDYIVDRCLEK